MVVQPSTTFLEALLRVSTEDLRRRAEDAAFDQLDSLFGVVVGNGFQFALGPFGFTMPVARLLTWGTRIGLQSVREWRQANAGTIYRVRNTGSGLLIAENTEPANLQRLPMVLPPYAEFDIRRLAAKRPPPRFVPPPPSTLKRTDSTSVFRELSRVQNRRPCPVCGQPIAKFGFLEIGHSPVCPSNVLRGSAAPRPQPGNRACIFCGYALAHAADCVLNPARLNAHVLLQRAAAWRNSPMNPMNPNSILNPNNPMNPNSRLHPTNMLNPANPNGWLNPNRRR